MDIIGQKLLIKLQTGFFFQAEDGIRDLVRSRGLGDVYKRQDRGTQFTSADYQQFLKDHHIISSMSAVGHCGDNLSLIHI